MRLDIQTAVVTGPTGILGTALTKKLVEEGVETYVICRPRSRRMQMIPQHPLIRQVECDLRAIRDLPSRVSGSCDAFFHFAWGGTEEPNNRLNMHLQNDNVKYTLDAVEAAHDLGCKVFIGAGSQAEYGYVDGVLRPDTPTNPVSGYGMAKLCAGQMTRVMCHTYGIRHIWPRIVSTYGVNDGPQTLISVVITRLLAGEKPALTAGEQVWDYLHGTDAAAAFWGMATKGRDGAVYVLGSGQTKTLREYMEIIRDAIDPKLPLGIGEIPYYPDQAMHLEADISALEKDLGWKPQMSFHQGIQELIQARRDEMRL